MSDIPEKIYLPSNFAGYIGKLNNDFSKSVLADDIEYTRTPQWQPIETAPRDGTHILGYWKTMRITDYPAVLYKDDCFLNPNAFSFVGKVELEEVFPTHWMPVPTPPKEQP